MNQCQERMWMWDTDVKRDYRYDKISICLYGLKRIWMRCEIPGFTMVVYISRDNNPMLDCLNWSNEFTKAVWNTKFYKGCLTNITYLMTQSQTVSTSPMSTGLFCEIHNSIIDNLLLISYCRSSEFRNEMWDT